MEIVVDIPDWAKDSVIIITAGSECIAYKYPGEPVKQKISRCNRCGDCCKDWDDKWFADETGKCNYLIDNKCSINTLDKPLICCFTPIKKYNENCTIEFG